MTSPTLRTRLASILWFIIALGATTLVADSAEAASPVVRVTADSLNVRSGPGTNFPIMTEVRRGTLLVVLNRREGWVRVKLAGGSRNGWVSSAYVRRVR